MVDPLVGVVMGSRSDWSTMRHCAEQLRSFGVPFETRVLSAHRTPGGLEAWVGSAGERGGGAGVRPGGERGVEVFIAAAGMAAALPGVVAANTTVPVLGVPMESKL